MVTDELASNVNIWPSPVMLVKPELNPARLSWVALAVYEAKSVTPLVYPEESPLWFVIFGKLKGAGNEPDVELTVPGEIIVAALAPTVIDRLAKSKKITLLKRIL